MSWTSDYGVVDKLLHRLAFATWPIQAAMADMEDVMFRARLESVELDRPVFVSGLPRAGTTLTLQLIEGAGEFASYRYRDMPFLLTPMLWNAMTGSAERSVKARERAHGDGVAIDLDSPEAFEEVVWRSLYPKKYGRASIQPWRGAIDEDKARFFRAQMRKIVALRSQGRAGPMRYLSKSNGNIARFATIAGMFPDAIIIAPYRRPLDHAGSLLRQHRNFLAMHRSDRFAREYMGAIGHYDFGMNLKPIDFDGWLEQGAAPDFTELSGWLRYWCAAYEYLLGQTELPIHFLSYDALCEDSAQELRALEATLGLAQPGALVGQAPEVRPGTAHVEDDVDAALLVRAQAILERLDARRLAERPTATAPKPARKRAAPGR